MSASWKWQFQCLPGELMTAKLVGPVHQICVPIRPDHQSELEIIAAAQESYASNVAMLAALDECYEIKGIHDDEYVYDALPSSGVARAYFMARAAVALAGGGA